jgi:outer membrane protein TolC
VAELQTGQLASQDALIRLRSAQRANRIRLYQALGGGFDAPVDAAGQTQARSR